LSSLSLQSNFFSGTVPIELGNLEGLSSLGLYYNNLTGSVPTTICQLQNYGLYSLVADCGGSEPEISCSCCTECYVEKTPSKQRRALVALYKSTGGEAWLKSSSYSGLNGWTGGDPCDGGWSGVSCDGDKNIVRIDLSNYGLFGSLPAEIGFLTMLTDLQLYQNTITGSIPTEVGLLSSLRYLMLFSNALSWTLPTEIGFLTGLEDLRLEHNGLTGTIPTEFGSLSSLDELYVYGNEFEGVMPSSVCALTSQNLDYLYADCEGSPPPITCSCCDSCY